MRSESLELDFWRLGLLLSPIEPEVFSCKFSTSWAFKIQSSRLLSPEGIFSLLMSPLELKENYLSCISKGKRGILMTLPLPHTGVRRVPRNSSLRLWSKSEQSATTETSWCQINHIKREITPRGNWQELCF